MCVICAVEAAFVEIVYEGDDGAPIVEAAAYAVVREAEVADAQSAHPT